MKKTIFLMALLMSALHVSAQGYNPKLTIQSPKEIFEATEDLYNYPYKRWFAAVQGEFYPYTPFISYTCLTKDSVIDGQNYVASSTVHYTSPDNANAMVICYRQEGDKVYYYNDKDHRDVLLFDFGLQVGDKFLDSYYGYISVAEVGTFPEVAQYLGLSRENKMLRLVDNYDGTDIDIWVEGIGSLRHGILPYTYPYNMEYYTLGLTFHGINDHFAVNLPTFKQQPFEPIDLTLEEREDYFTNEDGQPRILSATFEDDNLHILGITNLTPNTNDLIAILDENAHISLSLPEYEMLVSTNKVPRRYDVILSGFTCGTYTIDVNEKLGITEPITLEQTRYNLTVPYRAEDRVAQYLDRIGVEYYSDYRAWEYHTTNAEGKSGNLFTRAEKDVVFDGQTYVQLTNGWYGDLHWSYMRQVGKKVLRYNPDTRTETVVLDYSLDVGDIFTTECGDRMQVTEVGSFEEYAQYFYTGDGVRRMLRLQGVDNPKLRDVWIEGFGSVYTGVLPPELYVPYPEIHLKWRSDTGNFAVNQTHFKSIPFEAEELDRDTQYFLSVEATDEDIPFTCEFIGNNLHLAGYFYYTCSTSQYAELTIDDDGILNLSFDYPGTYYPVATCMWPGYFDLIFPDFEPGNYHISLTNLRGHTQEFDLTLEPTPYRPFIEEDKVWKVGWLPIYSNGESQANIYFYFDGDTIIDGRTCKKMVYEYREYKEEYQEMFDKLKSKFYEGAVYEADRQVLYAEQGRTKLGCLYDFSVEPGDSLTLPPYYDDYFNYVTEKKMGGVDGFKGRNWTILTSVNLEKLYGEDFNEEEYDVDFYTSANLWMEGVGSKFNPNMNLFYPFMKGNTWHLMECRVGDEVIYHNPDIIDGVNPPDDTKKRIDFTHVVKPKPKAPQQEAEADGDQLSGAYTLRLLDLDLGTMSDTYHVTITDDTGETVYDKTVRTADVLALNIDISEWTAPSYTITVENDYEQYVGTFSPTPTSISLPPTSTQIEKDGIIYDLQGRRVTTPTKGLYIKDGRKYLKR